MNIQEIRAKYPQYDDLNDDQLLQGFHKKFYADMPYEQFAAKVGAGGTAEPDYKPEKIGTAANVVSGMLRGAGSIGATILSPLDALGVSGMTNAERRKKMDAALSSLGADPSATSFQLGKVVAEIAGTAGAGGAVANTLARVPGVATAAPGLIQSIRTGGMVAGNAGMPTRIAGGALAGGSMAGLVNPEDADTGAMIGGAIPPVIKSAGMLGKALSTGAKKAIGATTGVGDEAIDAALQAGKTGNKTFVDNMRRQVPLTDVLDDAKAALGNIRAQRAAEYRANMANITSDQTVLNMNPVLDSVKNLKATGMFKGQVINKNAAGTVDDIARTVDDWAKLNPSEYHTPEGLDALKKAIGDIRDTTQFGTAARKSADEVYNAIKNQISMQAPTYSKTMKAYSEASDLITEVERSLSIGNKAAADTGMRKLQSLMRNNVQTNYGNRLDLANTLAKKGGADIIPAVAGQSLSSWMPRGLAKLGQYGAGIGAVLGNPGLAAALPVTSPRLMGEMLYGMGSAGATTTNTLRPIIGNPVLANNMPSIAEAMMVNPVFRAGLLATSP